LRVTVNGKAKELREGATLGDAVKGEAFHPGSLASVLLSTERLVGETDDFELMTPRGPMVLRLDDTDGARLWKSSIQRIEGATARWSTREIVAFGSFPTDIPTDRAERQYRKYDCFFTLGGSDNHTTYMMIAKKGHARSYGAGVGNIGRITLGRHVLEALAEGEGLTGIRPIVSEASAENMVATKDLGYRLEEGCSIDTNVLIRLDAGSPASAEHILAIASKGYVNVTQSSGTVAGCGDDLDVEIPDEAHSVRGRGAVAVRNTGQGTGNILFYKERRQSSPAHNAAGAVERGMGIISKAAAGDRVTVVTEPARALSVGMTQSEGGRFLSGLGIAQSRTGDASDDAVIVGQSPEATLTAMSSGAVETFGVPRERVFRIQLDESRQSDAYYFRKVTGLSHKPVGVLRTQFAFPGMPMVTFYGDEERSKSLFPQEPFKKCKKGDIGITNQSRPHHGLIGIRLGDSKEYGPTGEEPYGTNLVGRFLDDLGRLAELEEEETVYVMEERR